MWRADAGEMSVRHMLEPGFIASDNMLAQLMLMHDATFEQHTGNAVAPNSRKEDAVERTTFIDNRTSPERYALRVPAQIAGIYRVGCVGKICRRSQVIPQRKAT